MIKIENVNFSYSNQLVLENINYEIEKNDFAGIIGANGGGKSTMLKLILGILKPNSGKITINAKKTSYVPQAHKINPTFPISVIDLVLTGKLNKFAFFFSSKQDKIEATKCLELVGMKDYINKKFTNLSGGQQQRVLIARAILSGCDLLLLDEPTASIDAKGQIEIFELLKKLNDNGICILCVCHDVMLLSSYANKIINIQKTCYIHNDICGIDKNRLLHLANHKEHLCELELWKNYGISKI